MKNPMLLKPKMTVYVGLLVVAVGMMVWLNRCSQAASDGFVKSQGDTLDVAIEYSPLSLYTYDDTLGGFNHDLLQLISRYKGIDIKLHPVVSLDESLRMLDEGNYDIVAAQVPATTDFKARYLSSEPIYLDRKGLFGQQNCTFAARHCRKDIVGGERFAGGNAYRQSGAGNRRFDYRERRGHIWAGAAADNGGYR